MSLYIGVSAIYLLACIFAVGFIKNINSKMDSKKVNLCLFSILAVGVAVRLVIAFSNIAFWGDVNVFKFWVYLTDEYGLNDMFFSGEFLDYPPGYMYFLKILSLIKNFFNLGHDDIRYTALIKAPSMIFDMLTSLVIFKLAKKNLGEKWALFLTFAITFCPAVILNSAGWGQIDSLYTFIVVRSLYYLNENKFPQAAFAYAFAFLIKPQSILFGPVLLFWVLEKKDWKVFLKAVVSGAVSLYLLSLPFAHSLNPMWLVKCYIDIFGGYPYMTVNGYNIFTLFGLNFVKLEQVIGSEIISPLVILCTFVLSIWGYFCQKNRGKIFYTAGLFVTLLFTFDTMMHERYMFPVILLLLLTYIYTKREKVLYMFYWRSTVIFLNIGAVLMGEYNLWGKLPLIPNVIAAFTVAFAIYYIYDFVQLSLSEKTFEFTTSQKQKILVAFLMVTCTFVQFFRLGSTKAPETFWQSESIDEYIIYRFEQPENIKTVQSFSGMGNQFYPENEKKIGCEFEVFALDEDNTWVNIANLEHDYVFTLEEQAVDFVTDTVMIRPLKENQVLGEIVFLNDRNERIDGKTYSDYDFSDMAYSPVFAFDERDTSPVSADKYYYSMYFDEIYHARTGYETLKGYDIYETTHPPLGKHLIAFGISIFGMNPFGWRFMGALRGVAMVGVMYLIAKELFGKFTPAFVTAVIFAFDFMRFTQTRIATVDSFVVLFVMLMFYYMIVWAKIPLGKNKTASMLCLLLSGIYMGCAVSTKWNGAYSAVGLAVVFFAALWFKSKKYMETHNKNDALKVAFTTCLWCVLFFVVVPFMIYFITFVPVMHADGLMGNITEFVRWQTNMFDYHHNLEATHFFASLWYTWLIDLKPIWYSINHVGNVASSISAFGNPMIWIPMLAALAYISVMSIKRKDKTGFVIIAGYLSSLLPWVLITRLTFIYHYFPATVFGILALGYVINDLMKNKKNRKFICAYLALVIACFVIFFPVISGLPVSAAYIDSLELLPTWYFVN